jgi:hypothetical protein
MTNQSNKEKALERILTGFGLVALAAVFLATGADFDPLIFWAVS